MQVIAEVVEASIEEYEEGMQACFDAAKIWMQVRSSFTSSVLSNHRKMETNSVFYPVSLSSLPSHCPDHCGFRILPYSQRYAQYRAF